MNILFPLAAAGSAIAGLWDLKTTEVPDELPVAMSAFGLFYWFVASLFAESIAPFVLSLLSGLAFLVPGLLLYRAGKWGEADAWVPASILFMVPVLSNAPILFDYAVNFSIVSSAYMIVYSLALGAMNPEVFSLLVKDAKDNKAFHWVVGLVGVLLVVSLSLGITPEYAFSVFAITSLLAVFWRYALVIEKHVFRKEISSAQLREGDVLDDMVWRGMTKEEVADIKRKKKKVIIKEGVRFVPVYPITLIMTAVYGNVIVAVLGGAL